jgi:hypothetical protein
MVEKWRRTAKTKIWAQNQLLQGHVRWPNPSWVSMVPLLSAMISYTAVWRCCFIWSDRTLCTPAHLHPANVPVTNINSAANVKHLQRTTQPHQNTWIFVLEPGSAAAHVAWQLKVWLVALDRCKTLIRSQQQSRSSIVGRGKSSKDANKDKMLDNRGNRKKQDRKSSKVGLPRVLLTQDSMETDSRYNMHYALEKSNTNKHQGWTIHTNNYHEHE